MLYKYFVFTGYIVYCSLRAEGPILCHSNAWLIKFDEMMIMKYIALNLSVDVSQLVTN